MSNDTQKAIDICMEQAQLAFKRAEEFGKKDGGGSIGVIVWGDRGAASYQCAVRIAEAFGMPTPDIGLAATEAAKAMPELDK